MLSVRPSVVFNRKSLQRFHHSSAQTLRPTMKERKERRRRMANGHAIPHSERKKEQISSFFQISCILGANPVDPSVKLAKIWQILPVRTQNVCAALKYRICLLRRLNERKRRETKQRPRRKTLPSSAARFTPGCVTLLCPVVPNPNGDLVKFPFPPPPRKCVWHELR